MKNFTDAIATDNLETIRVLNVVLEEFENLLVRNRENLAEIEELIAISRAEGNTKVLADAEKTKKSIQETIDELVFEIDDTKKSIKELQTESIGLASMGFLNH